MKKTSLIVFVSIFMVGTPSCNKRVSESPNFRVATSIFPICDMTMNLVGKKAEVFFVVPVGANPHTYEPVPSVVRKLQEVDLFIGVHDRLDGWMEEYLSEKALIRYLNKEEAALSIHHQAENPHIWLTVKGAIRLVRTITAYLSELDPGSAPYYSQNLTSYVQRLEVLDQDLASLFEGTETKKFIQWHPAWDFLAEDYGLEIVGTIEHGHGDEPSVREFKNLVERAREEKVKVIVVGLNVNSKATDALRREIDGKLIRLDTLGDPRNDLKDSYVELMLFNAKILADALNQSR